ncbi:MAG: hypothetical protein LBD92_03855 [Oscillospiraceae bacterium]|nr:hypothetical protein [Oscillospiraceae bacterium]
MTAAAFARKFSVTLLFQVKQSFSTWRVRGIFILVGVFIWMNAQPVGDFAASVGLGVRPWLFGHFVNDFVCQLIFTAACVALFADAPWDTAMSLYILPRSGKLAQCAGHVLYVAVMALLFTLFIFFVSVAAVLPVLEFGEGWGKALGTLARTNASSQFAMTFAVNDFLIGAYTPVQATLRSFFLEWACFTWLGLTIYLLNRNISRTTGTFAAVVFVLLDITVANELSKTVYHFSPITLAQVTSLVGLNAHYGITLRYAVLFFGCGIAALILVNLIMARRRLK